MAILIFSIIFCFLSLSLSQGLARVSIYISDVCLPLRPDQYQRRPMSRCVDNNTKPNQTKQTDPSLSPSFSFAPVHSLVSTPSQALIVAKKSLVDSAEELRQVRGQIVSQQAQGGRSEADLMAQLASKEDEVARLTREREKIETFTKNSLQNFTNRYTIHIK